MVQFTLEFKILIWMLLLQWISAPILTCESIWQRLTHRLSVSHRLWAFLTIKATMFWCLVAPLFHMYYSSRRSLPLLVVHSAGNGIILLLQVQNPRPRWVKQPGKQRTMVGDGARWQSHIAAISSNAPVLLQWCHDRALLFICPQRVNLKFSKALIPYVLIFRNNTKPRDWGKCILWHSSVLAIDAVVAALKTKEEKRPSPELVGKQNTGVSLS